MNFEEERKNKKIHWIHYMYRCVYIISINIIYYSHPLTTRYKCAQFNSTYKGVNSFIDPCKNVKRWVKTKKIYLL